MADKIIKGSVEIQDSLTVNGKLNPNSNGYGINLPDTSTLTGDITIATTGNIVTYTFSEGSVDKAFTVKPNNGPAQTVNIHGLGDASLKGVSTTVAAGDTNLITSGAVYTAIDNLPEPMVYKGTLGTGGTITTLPTASPTNEGFTYKVITAGTYASQEAKVGDVFISNGSAWTLVPAGDDVDDTWRNIRVNNTELLGTGISTGAVNFKDSVNTEIAGEGNDISITAIPAIETTWAELKALRDNNQLIPGQSYRITDYITTTVQENTQSAGHPFDLIVRADSSSALNEKAFAIQSDRDTQGYFTNSNLSAWQVSYSLDNDTSRFKWADTTNGKGVIYWLRDEFGNDLPYDFKNIQFKAKVFVEMIFRGMYYDASMSRLESSDITIDNVPYYAFFFIVPNSGVEETYYTKSLTDLSTWYAISGEVVTVTTNVKVRALPGISLDSFYYTFATDGSDASINEVSRNVYSNTFEEYRDNGIQALNSNIFVIRSGSSVCRNKIGSQSHHNTIDSNFKLNTIGHNFYYNTIGPDFGSNIIDDYFYENSIGSNFNSNAIESDFYRNTISSYFSSNSIGSGFMSSTIGFGFSFNTTGLFFSGNTIGEEFTYNLIGQHCISNIIGGYFTSNTIGSDFRSNIVGDSVSEKVYVRYCKFDDGIQYISLTSADTSATSSNYLQNVHVHLGVKGISTSNRLTVSVYDRNLPFEVEFYLDDSGNLVMSNFASKISWAALKALRDGSNLVPGRKYRITDYATTTTQADTQSAGHVFDIIVEAVSGNALSEEAQACLHTGDTYFANSKLTAWKLWYCLDNDTSRFAWADSTNGKGVIYRMIDEFGNDVPYDFKNLQFTTAGKYTNAYTFSYTENSVILDASLLGLTKSCYRNVMREYISSDKQQLNFNVFYSASTSFYCYSNTFATGCSKNTFSYSCSKNTFGNDCSSSIFDHGCSNNTFSSDCSRNTFSTDCDYNTLDCFCSDNTFGMMSSSNMFGTQCSRNNIGARSSSNIFGRGCSRNTLLYGCSRNTLASGCTDNKFGETCYEITIGSGCLYVTIGSYVEYLVVEDSCQYITIDADDGGWASFIQYVKVCCSLKGASSSNPLLITPVRNVTYEQEFVNANKVVTQINV